MPFIAIVRFDGFSVFKKQKGRYQNKTKTLRERALKDEFISAIIAGTWQESCINSPISALFLSNKAPKAPTNVLKCFVFL